MISPLAKLLARGAPAAQVQLVFMTNQEPPPVHLMRALHRAIRYLDHEDRSQVANYGLQLSEFDVVATLGSAGGLRMSDLADRMLTSAPNVTRVVKRLEERGLVRRVRGELSDREVVAHLTSEGEALYERVYPEHYHFLDNLFSHRFEQRDIRELIDLLERIPANSEPDA
jgi:DNA-binding MarR family transcriptional regulator